MLIQFYRSIILSSVLVCVLTGCAVVDFAMPDKRPYYRQLWENYNNIKLNDSTSADVLAVIKTSEDELISQSKSVIASLGQKRQTYHTWFILVAFDENLLTASRKHLLIVNEKPKILLAEPWEGVTYDCRMLLEKELLEKPFAGENARRIAILKQVLENVRKDIDQVSPDNKMLGVGGMMINQAIEAVIVKLEVSPAQAERLSNPEGLEFEHISLDKGRIQMLLENGSVKVKVMLGSFVRYFQKRQEQAQL
ncbi:MAG: hypothetical protein JXB29_04870 [Sedimentisphaerales bacterium]|nr:hypothetical protein [Sedimentisphaerales bacterium]